MGWCALRVGRGVRCGGWGAEAQSNLFSTKFPSTFQVPAHHKVPQGTTRYQHFVMSREFSCTFKVFYGIRYILP